LGAKFYTHSPVEYSTRTAPIPGNNPDVSSAIPPSKTNPVSSATRNKPTVPTELEAQVMQGYQKPPAPFPGSSKPPSKPVAIAEPVAIKSAPVTEVSPPATQAVDPIQPPVAQPVVSQEVKPSVSVSAEQVPVEPIKSKIETSLQPPVEAPPVIEPVVAKAPASAKTELPKSSTPPSMNKKTASPSQPPQKTKTVKVKDEMPIGKSRSRESEAIKRRIGDKAVRLEPDASGNVTYKKPNGETKSVPLSSDIDIYEINGETYSIGTNPQHGSYGKMTSLDGKKTAFDVYDDKFVSSGEAMPTTAPPPKAPAGIKASKGRSSKAPEKPVTQSSTPPSAPKSAETPAPAKAEVSSPATAPAPTSASKPVTPPVALAPPKIPSSNPTPKPTAPAKPVAKKVSLDELSGQEILDTLKNIDTPMARHMKGLIEEKGVGYKPTPKDWKEARALSNDIPVDAPTPTLDKPGVKYSENSLKVMQSKDGYKRLERTYRNPRTYDRIVEEFELIQDGPNVKIIDSKSRKAKGSFLNTDVESAFKKLEEKMSETK